MQPVRVTAAALALVVALAAFWPTAPATHRPPSDNTGPLTLHEMQITSAALDERLGPGERVFTIRANYYAFSDHPHAFTSRVWMLVTPRSGSGQPEGFHRIQRAHEVRIGLRRMLTNGDIGLVIMTRRTAYFIRFWPDVHQAFREHYCRVEPPPEAFQPYDASLYEYAPARTGPECRNTITKQWLPD